MHFDQKKKSHKWNNQSFGDVGRKHWWFGFNVLLNVFLSFSLLIMVLQINTGGAHACYFFLQPSQIEKVLLDVVMPVFFFCPFPVCFISLSG